VVDDGWYDSRAEGLQWGRSNTGPAPCEMSMAYLIFCPCDPAGSCGGGLMHVDDVEREARSDPLWGPLRRHGWLEVGRRHKAWMVKW
jgi:hypothetical protein